jgi:hypothetical protein
MFNSIVLISVAPFTNGKLDKNGKQSMLLNVIAGKSPNRNVISGTVAENTGFEAGKLYLAQVREREADAKFGRQFSWIKLADASVADTLDSISKLGNAEIFNVEGVNADVTAEINVTDTKEAL